MNLNCSVLTFLQNYFDNLKSTMQLFSKVIDIHYCDNKCEVIQVVSMVSWMDDHCVGLTAILHPLPGLKMHNGASCVFRTLI